MTQPKYVQITSEELRRKLYEMDKNYDNNYPLKERLDDLRIWRWRSAHSRILIGRGAEIEYVV